MNFRKTIQKAIRQTGYNITRYYPPDYRWISNRSIKTVIDIGANEGQFARLINDIIPGVNIHSFEPVKNCYEALKKNSNHLNITTHNFALGEKNYTSEINVSSHTPSSSILKMADLHKELYEFSKDHIIEQIEIKSLDDIFHELKIEKNILVKIDVQGFEDKVIMGGSKSIKQAEIVLIETSFKELYMNQVLFDSIYQMLKELGFSYTGNFHQTFDPNDGNILYADSIFIKPGKMV